MIYVPILKTRQYEMLAVKKINNCLCDSIIPLFEVINENFSKNKTVYERIDEVIGNKMYFIDYFRFGAKEYKGDKAKLKALETSLSLREMDKYIDKLIEFSLNQKDNAIIVISIKKEFEINKDKLNELIKIIKKNNRNLAIRIEADLLRMYFDSLLQLDENDYLLFDIRNSSIYSQYMNYKKMNESSFICKKILLNSPRDKDRANTEYELSGYTTYIDNSVAVEYPKYHFDGFGDFGGLRDKLPELSGGNGKGSATAFIYVYQENKFWIEREEDTEKGLTGYFEVKRKLEENRKQFDPNNDCPAFKEIERINNGVWGNWVTITLMRYIDQMHRRDIAERKQ